MKVIDIRDYQEVPVFIFYHVDPTTGGRIPLFISENAEQFFSCLRFYTKKMCDMLLQENVAAFAFETKMMTRLEVSEIIFDIKSTIKAQELANAEKRKNIPPQVPKNHKENVDNLIQFPDIYKKRD